MKNALARLRPLFLARTRREKFFLVLFVVAGAVVWFLSVSSRASNEAGRLQAVLGLMNQQDLWLDDRERIEADYAAAIANLSNRPNLTKNEVLANIQGLLRKYGFTAFTLNPPTSKQNEGLTFHTYNLQIQRADFTQLRSFAGELTASMPTVNLEEINIQAERQNPNDRSNARQLGARLRLVAVEFNR